MAISNQDVRNAFDFSLDAGSFKQKLWNRLKECGTSAIEALNDEDLAWVNAAGVPHPMPESDDPL